MPTFWMKYFKICYKSPEVGFNKNKKTGLGYYNYYYYSLEFFTSA